MADKGPYRITYDVQGEQKYGSPYHYVPRGKVRFSRVEGRHILVAFLFLVAAFLIFFIIHGGPVSNLPLSSALPLALLISVTSVLTGFLLHELMHKYYAQKFGAWAEFRYSFFGLILGIFTSFLGLILAAPGAVYISGSLTRRENGVVSAAGPLTNTAFSYIFLGAAFATASLGQLWTTFFAGVAFLDAWLGAFNMIPVPPLDGSKVIAWNMRAYAACLLLPALAIGILFFAGLPPFG